MHLPMKPLAYQNQCLEGDDLMEYYHLLHSMTEALAQNV